MKQCGSVFLLRIFLLDNMLISKGDKLLLGDRTCENSASDINYFLVIEVVQTLAVRRPWEFGTDFTFSLPVLICATDNAL